MSAQKVVILTGASRGIGLAIAHCLLKQPCNVVVIARSREPLEALNQQYPGQVKVVAGDIADPAISKEAHDIATSTWKRVDGLIINHGVLDPVKRVANTDAEEWRQCFDINVFSAISMVKACLPSLRESGGRIVMCSSGAATGHYATWGAYGASKAAMNHLVGTLAVEEPSVTTVSIRPGVVDTAMQQAIRETHHTAMEKDDAAKFKELHSSGSLLRPEQPGNVMARLSLDMPKELSGKFLTWNDEALSAFQD